MLFVGIHHFVIRDVLLYLCATSQTQFMSG